MLFLTFGSTKLNQINTRLYKCELLSQQPKFGGFIIGKIAEIYYY